MKWIYTHEKLPDITDGRPLIVTYASGSGGKEVRMRNRYVTTAIYCGDGKWKITGRFWKTGKSERIVAWMEYPTPALREGLR